MFIEQALPQRKNYWKYLVGILTVVIATFIGQIPLVVALFYKSMITGEPVPTETMEVLNYLPPNSTLALMLLSFVSGLGALFLVVRFLHKQTIREVTTVRQKIDWKRVFFAFGLWAGITICFTGIDYLMNPQDYVWNFKPLPFMILFVIVVTMLPLQTSFEEYFFRGYLMQAGGILVLNRAFPLIMTSVIFGLMHIANPEVDKMGYTIMIFYIGTGLFLGIITLMDDGMELALGFHAANNMVQALLISADWTAINSHSLLRDVSEPSTTTDIVLPVLIIYPIILIIFSRKYKWSGWKKKLAGNISLHGNPVLQEDARQSDI